MYNELDINHNSEIDKISAEVNKKIIEWTDIRCKFTLANFLGGGQTTEDREKGLAKILTYDITEKEPEWLNYYKEETQISKVKQFIF